MSWIIGKFICCGGVKITQDNNWSWNGAFTSLHLLKLLSKLLPSAMCAYWLSVSILEQTVCVPASWWNTVMGFLAFFRETQKHFFQTLSDCQHMLSFLMCRYVGINLDSRCYVFLKGWKRSEKGKNRGHTIVLFGQG